MTTDEHERVKALEREVKELRRANKILKLASAFFRSGGARPQAEINAFIDQYRADFWVEPICRVLQVATSAYWRHVAQIKNPELRSQRAKRGEQLLPIIKDAWTVNC